MKTIVCYFCLVIALVSTLASNAVAAVTLGGGRIADLKDGTQLVFDISEATVPETFLLDDPPRYVIDIRNASARGLNLNLSSRDVRGVRSGSPNGRDLRIVVDLGAVIRGKVSIVRDGQHRLVIDLFRNQPGQALNAKPAGSKPTPIATPLRLISKAEPLPSLELVSRSQDSSAARQPRNNTSSQAGSRQPEPQQPSAAQAEPRQAKPQQPSAAQVKPRNVEPQQLSAAQAEPRQPKPQQAEPRQPSVAQAKAKPATVSPSRPVTTIQRKRRPILIAIDPGHGGKDSGAVGPAGTREKDVVLQIARRLQKAINQQPGMKAFLTRSGDYYLRLYRRIAIARSKKADLFVSIHADAYLNSRPQGASVFMLSTKGASSTMARFLAESENKSDLIDDDLNIEDKQLRKIVLEMVHDAVLADSDVMAGEVLGQLKKIGKLHSRKVERANFAVLKSPDIPSILVETAFISNPSEERKLRSKGYQEKLARAILAGIKAYIKERPMLGVELVEVSNSNKRHTVRRGDTLWEIAQQYKVNLDDLISVNGLNRNSPRLHVGAQLKIPQGG